MKGIQAIFEFTVWIVLLVVGFIGFIITGNASWLNPGE